MRVHVCSRAGKRSAAIVAQPARRLMVELEINTPLRSGGPFVYDLVDGHLLSS